MYCTVLKNHAMATTQPYCARQNRRIASPFKKGTVMGSGKPLLKFTVVFGDAQFYCSPPFLPYHILATGARNGAEGSCWGVMSVCTRLAIGVCVFGCAFLMRFLLRWPLLALMSPTSDTVARSFSAFLASLALREASCLASCAARAALAFSISS